jgi:uncharacterized protein (DUF1697 family)
MVRHIAFLRGINVGGHRKIKMEALRQEFESLEFQNVKTLLNSGNVLFEAHGADPDALAQKIEEKLRNTSGYEINVILRTLGEIQDLVDSDPFKDIIVTPQTRLYVTFLAESPASSLKAPYELPGEDFKIVRITNGEVCSVLTLRPGSRTPDAMGVLEKEFGKKITTRNWNTVTKLLKS